MASFAAGLSPDSGADTSRDRKHDSMEPCGPMVMLEKTAPDMATPPTIAGNHDGFDMGALGIFASDQKHDSMNPLQQAGVAAKRARATSRKAKTATMYLDPQAQQDFHLTQLYLSEYGRQSTVALYPSTREPPLRKPSVVIQTQELESSTESIWVPPFASEQQLSPGNPMSINLSPRTPINRHQSSPSALTPSSQIASPLEDLPTWTTLPPRRPYAYKPLASRSDIRLLSVTVSELDGKLYFQLPRQSLNDCPPYEAVSYTWGGNVKSSSIYHAYSGEVLRVTDNCEAVLRSLHDNGNRRFWIDAICIDQNDVEERSTQVAQMADVFRNATRTVIYLGDADIHTAALVQWPKTRRLVIGMGIETENTASDRAYEHAKVLLQRPWFTRTWIIQEVLLSKKLHMQAGKDVIDIVELSSLINAYETGDKHALGIIDILHRYGSELSTKTKHAHRLAWRDPSRHSALQSIVPSKGYLKYWQLFNLLMETRAYGCQDPRDKLYALISLFDGDPPSELVPDYSLPVEEVYANISRYLIASENTTAVLSLALGAHYSSPFPSWAIDWRTVLPVIGSRVDRNSCRAGFLHGRQQIPALPSSGETLKLRGIKVAVVHLVLAHTSSAENHELPKPTRIKELKWELPRRSRPRTPVHEMQLPVNTWPLDIVCVFIGFEMPFVLRQVVRGWLLVGECYIDGLMSGEGIEGVDWDRVNDERATFPAEDFDIL